MFPNGDQMQVADSLREMCSNLLRCVLNYKYVHHDFCLMVELFEERNGEDTDSVVDATMLT